MNRLWSASQFVYSVIIMLNDSGTTAVERIFVYLSQINSFQILLDPASVVADNCLYQTRKILFPAYFVNHVPFSDLNFSDYWKAQRAYANTCLLLIRDVTHFRTLSCWCVFTPSPDTVMDHSYFTLSFLQIWLVCFEDIKTRPELYSSLKQGWHCEIPIGLCSSKESLVTILPSERNWKKFE